MNRAMIRRLAEHIYAEHVEVHQHDYKKANSPCDV